MFATPRTRVGKWSFAIMSVGTLWLVLVGGALLFMEALVLAGVTARPVDLVAVLIFRDLVFALPFMAAVGAASLVLAVIAIVRAKDRPRPLYVLAGINLLLSVIIVGGFVLLMLGQAPS